VDAPLFAGVYVQGGGTGIYSEQTLTGLQVGYAFEEGVSVLGVGDSPNFETPTLENGFEIGGAGGNGLFVGGVRHHGVKVISATLDGVSINHAGDDGIQIGDGTDSASYGMYTPGGVDYVALLVDTKNISHEWALLTYDKVYALNVTASSMQVVAQVEGSQPLGKGDVVAASGVAVPLPGSTSPVPQVRLAGETTAEGVIGVVESRMELRLAPGKEGDGVRVLYSVPGPARSGDYVAMTVMGVAEVKVDASAGGIVPGERLTAASLGGHARSLRTETLNGMTVSEGAPVIGIALAAPEVGSSTIPVFVTLR
jgi:hypothetical protein